MNELLPPCYPELRLDIPEYWIKHVMFACSLLASQRGGIAWIEHQGKLFAIRMCPVPKPDNPSNLSFCFCGGPALAEKIGVNAAEVMIELLARKIDKNSDPDKEKTYGHFIG